MSAASGYDYVIVGAGAAGCVLAARLSEDAGARVLLLEAGGSDRTLATTIPLMTFLASAAPKRNWSFATEPVPALNGRTLLWNQGRLIGGSSSINGLIYMRGHPEDYDAWSRAGCRGWSFAELLPFFKRSEANSRGEGPWHGGSGPIKVRPTRLELPICDAFLAAAAQAGYPIVEDLNARVDEGFGRFDSNIDRGIRSSSARAYLRPALRRPNLTVLRDALALRVLVERDRARGVEVLRGGSRQIFHATREIVLAGGALNSPSLLIASGIGPKDHLGELRIPVVADSPEVGRNLKNHPAYLDPYGCVEPVTLYSYLSPAAGLKACWDYVRARGGPLAESFCAVGGYVRSRPDMDRADAIVMLLPSFLRRASGGDRRWWDLLPKEHGFFVVTSLGRPKSVGRIRLRSPVPGEPPRIDPGFFEDPRDLQALVESVRRVRRALRQPAIRRFIDPLRSKPDSDDPREIEAEIRTTAISLSHPSGTCRMGADPDAVVDPDLRVNGVSGLRVADNSIMPDTINACTHAVALMIGEKASELIRDGSCRPGPLSPFGRAEFRRIGRA